jgi:pentapeptide repeat protein
MPDQEAVTRLNNGTPYRSLAPISGRDLSNVTVKGDFSDALLDSVDFTGAQLKGSNFKATNFSACNLHGSDWTNCDFKNAQFNGGNLSQVKNAHRAKNLITVKVVDPQPAHSFETVVRPWWVWLDWERMGVLGRLPFFTASTAVLVLFPIFFYFLDLYNNHLAAWKTALAARAGTSEAAALGSAALARLSPLQPPPLSILALVSALLLFIASLLYAFFCPGRVKQFSSHQWRDELKRPLLEYWPYAWRFQHVRMTCAACYALGALLAVWIIGNKLVTVFAYIARNATFSWYG